MTFRFNANTDYIIAKVGIWNWEMFLIDRKAKVIWEYHKDYKKPRNVTNKMHRVWEADRCKGLDGRCCRDLWTALNLEQGDEQSLCIDVLHQTNDIDEAKKFLNENLTRRYSLKDR